MQSRVNADALCIFVDHFALPPPCGKVMFSQVSACDSVLVGGQGGPHVTITHDALDFTVQPSQSRHGTWGTPQPKTRPLLVTSHGHHWRPVQTCPLDLIVHRDPLPMVLTTGGDPSTYAWQAGGMHPTGMLELSLS